MISTESPPSRSTIVILKLIAAAVLIVLVWLLSDVLLMIFAAILVAIAYRGSAEWLAERTGIPVGWALLIVAVVVAAFVAGTLWWTGGTLLDQLGQLWAQLTDRLADVTNALHGTTWGDRIGEYIGSQRFWSGAEALAGRFAGAAFTTLGVFAAIVIIVFTAVYLAVNPNLYARGLVRLLAVDYRERGWVVLTEIGVALRRWLIGRAIDMLVVIVLTFGGLLLLDVPLAFLLALIAGVLNFIPYIGAVVGAVPAIVVAFGQGPVEALWVVLLFAAIQTVEGYLLVPFIQQRTVQLPPALLIFSQTVFGTLFGILGLLLAPALMLVILIVVQAVYLHDVLGDRDLAERFNKQE
jgi:predicted PurR-regulated permease PerM